MVTLAVLPDRLRRPLRHFALAGLAASFPLLYAGAVSMESAGVTVAGLAVAGVTAAVAWAAF